MPKIAYEAHAGSHTSGLIEDLEEAMQKVEAAGAGMLLSLVEETEYYPVMTTRWRTSAAWGYIHCQWFAIDLHGWSDRKQPVPRGEVGQ